jgi:two-component system response regulator VicR
MKTILIVDDEYAIVEVLTGLLEDEGYHVISAPNAKDGLVRVEKERPDLVLVDYMMPIGDGREMVEGMRALPDHHTTPVIMMSAAAKHTALSDGRGGVLDVSLFLSKPFALDDLLEGVTALIGRADKGRTVH